ncbi:unnamed protein product [Cylicocyclus nassatus]|uniref:G-protein coupled receptors family 1 profile domain-containing protein n=1 Tax=Cylicocyclus nassatus TaxID=53992 RepID=A0AA36HD19_CYLNA|nr:unnamed protein product [Cylicocyclus nassatus]
MMNETDFASLPVINYVEAVLIVFTFVMGFMVNFMPFLVIIRHKSFHNSFGYIIAYNALANVFVLLVIGVWAAPWTLFAVPKSVQGANLFFGQTALFFLEAGFHGNLLITLNRFAAVTFPLKYRLWFTPKSTIIMLICMTCVPLAYSTIFFIGVPDISGILAYATVFQFD